MRKTNQYFNEKERLTIEHFEGLGVKIYKPMEPNSDVDFIAEFNGKANRIKVKASKKAKNGLIRFDLNSTQRHLNIPPDENLDKKVDYYACYSYVRNRVYLVPVSKAPKTEVSVRFGGVIKKDSKRIRKEKDVILDKIISTKELTSHVINS